MSSKQTGKISVVIVEDHAVTLSGLKAELALEADIEVVGGAPDARLGLSLTQSSQPDVVLLDLHLPDADGPKTLVTQFVGTGSRIVVFSGDNREVFIELVLKLGVSGYLLKTETAASVAHFLRQVMQGHAPVLSMELSAKRTRLTEAENHLLRLLARGMKYQDIAAVRVTAPETVRKQCEALAQKLQLSSREELISWAARHGYANVEIN